MVIHHLQVMGWSSKYTPKFRASCSTSRQVGLSGLVHVLQEYPTLLPNYVPPTQLLGGKFLLPHEFLGGAFESFFEFVTAFFLRDMIQFDEHFFWDGWRKNNRLVYCNMTIEN